MVEVFVGTLGSLVIGLGLSRLGLGVVARTLPRERRLVRGIAAAVVALLAATLVFHLLLSLGQFRLVPASVVAALLGGVGWALERSDPRREQRREQREEKRRDEQREERNPSRLERELRRLFDARRWPAIACLLFFASFAAVTVTRSLSLPTVGWDSITYHYVKAAMWVQTGGPIDLEAPGGWSMYRAIFGGGEIFSAWTMLSFGNDLLVGAVDAFFWLGIGVCLLALGREWGLRVRHRVAVACYALFIPALWDAVGWGYVDLTLTALLLAGWLFTTRAFRGGAAPHAGFAMASFGLAAGTKLTAVPVLAAAGALFLFRLLRGPRQARSAHLAWLALGSVTGLACIAPWLIQNLVETGYPLRFPMTVFGVPLGRENPAFAWSQDRVLPAYTLAAEFEALRALFPWPWVNTSHLSIFSLVPLALAPIGAIRIARTRSDLRLPLWMAAFIVGAVLVAFYDRAFSFSRLEFTWVNGRFLQAIVLISLPLAFAAIGQRSRLRDALAGVLLLGAALQCLSFAPLRFLQPTPGVVFAGLAVGLVIVAIGVAVLRRPRPFAVWVGTLAGLLLLASQSLDRLRELDTRYMLLVGRNVSDDVFRYWWQAGHLLEREGAGLRIAVTAGPRQDADNWLMYYFLGTDLQNTLHYLPISTDGEIIPFGPEERRRREGDVDAWLERIKAQEISHVFSFFPASIELEWMEARPAQFQRLAGYQNEWALYRVRRAPEANPGSGPQ